MRVDWLAKLLANYERNGKNCLVHGRIVLALPDAESQRCHLHEFSVDGLDAPMTCLVVELPDELGHTRHLSY